MHRLIGEILTFACDQSKLDLNHFLPCDGREVSRKEFHELFCAIGTTYGDGDGLTTFRIPNYQGRFLRGYSGESGFDPDAGARTASATGGIVGNNVGTLQGFATALPTNSFKTSTDGGHRHLDPTYNGGSGQYELAVEFRGPGGFDYGDQAAPTSEAGQHEHLVQFGGDTETRPVNVSVLYAIRHR